MHDLLDGVKDSALYFRRVGHAALWQAFTDTAGIPADYLILPQQDDHLKLMVLPPDRVLWLGGTAGQVIASVCFESAYTGTVYADNMNLISDSQDYWPDNYGFERPYRAELKFDLTDMAETHHAAWADLPKAQMRKRPRIAPITVTSSMGRVTIVGGGFPTNKR